MHFGYVLTAMVTPFDVNENIDFQRTTQLIEHLIANGTDGVIVAGTTGESVTLSHKEIEQLFKHVVTVVKGRIPVIAGTGTNNTKASINLTVKAEQLGVDGIMLVAPYYNRPNQSGLFNHFKTIANETSLPIMLYNIPGRSSVHIDAKTIIELSKIDNIVSVKEASGNLDHTSMIIDQTADDFTVYSGDDGMTLPILSIGGNGVVSVASHIIGNDIQEMIQTFRQGQVDLAAQMHRKLLPIMNGLFSAPSPTPTKAALKLIGVDVGSVRLPLVPLTETEEANLQKLIVRYEKHQS